MCISTKYARNECCVLAHCQLIMAMVCTEHVGDSEVMMELFQLIGRLSVRDEFCQKVLELGGVANILSALQNNISDKVFIFLNLSFELCNKCFKVCCNQAPSLLHSCCCFFLTHIHSLSLSFTSHCSTTFLLLIFAIITCKHQ